jgi:hypothetical protein
LPSEQTISLSFSCSEWRGCCGYLNENAFISRHFC